MYRFLFHILVLNLLFFSSYGYSQDSIRRTITLQELFDLADNNSKVLQLSLANIEESKEKHNITKTANLPDINLGISAAYLSNTQIFGLGNMPSGNYTDPHFYNTFSLEAVYIVYAGGNINRTINISELETEMAKLKHQNTRMDIRLMLAGSYLDLYTVQNQQQVLKKNIEQTELLLVKMQNRLKAGTILRSDLIRYELQLSSLKFALSKANNRLKIINEKLVETLNLSTSTQLVATVSATENKSLKQDSDKNIDIQIAALQNKMAEKNLDINKSNLLPNVALFATNNLNRPYIYTLPPTDIYYNIWLAGVKVSFNIGNLYKNKAHVSQAKMQYKQSEIGLAISEEKVRIQKYEANVHYQEAIEQLAVAQKELELATENYTMIINQYNNQLSLITDVMDASNSKLNAELKLENSKAAILFAFYQIQRVTGNL